MAYNPDPTKPMFTSLQYCARCGMPSTERDASFDHLGICLTCTSLEQKMYMDWTERERALRELFDKNRGKGDYDCIVPISGGKDSAFQLHLVVNVFKLKALAVTFSHNWFSETGMKNLRWCLETFNVDHLMFTPSRSLVNRCARHSLKMIGDTCWHCHAGIGSFPWRVAVKHRIPLIIHGESAAEASPTATYEKLKPLTVDYTFEGSAGFRAKEFVTDDLSERDLAPFMTPSREEIEEVGVIGVHIGNYIFWDAERQTEILRDRYGWQEDHVEGTYKCYKSVECRMPGMHDFTKFLKRGYGRATDHVAQDRRAGLITASEGNQLIREFDPRAPEALKEYLKLSGYSEEEFYSIMDAHREKIGVLTAEELKDALDDFQRNYGGRKQERPEERSE
jgi:N-acetyl sugar amidotransferase